MGDLGLDSLLTVELVLLLENDYHIVVSPKELREITINNLKKMEAENRDKIGDKNGDKNGGKGSDEQSASVTGLLKDGSLLATEMVVKMNNVDGGVPLFIVHDMFGETFHTHNF